jgi:tetratricopeptide (TPR) repeat protein
MRMMLALLLQTAAPAQTPPPPPPLHGGPAPIVCPVGGERFSAWRPTAYSTYGERPDGRPYSYLPFPLPIPECPSNKLVVFDDFSPAEVATLTTLVATPDYRRLAEEAPTYYRAAWLATKLGRPESDALGLLLAATWQVKGGDMAPPSTPERAAKARRYQEEFARRAMALPESVTGEDRLWIEARGANALRELGRFDEAEALRRKAVATLEDGDSEAEGWRRYLDALELVVARHDSSVEPLDMIPDRQVAWACIDEDRALTAFDQAVCSAPETAKQIEGIKAMEARMSEAGDQTAM